MIIVNRISQSNHDHPRPIERNQSEDFALPEDSFTTYDHGNVPTLLASDFTPLFWFRPSPPTLGKKERRLISH